MSTVRRSVMFSGLSQYISQLLALITTAIMARLLTPAETGQVMIAVSIIGLVESFRSFGLANYLVQERELDADILRTAFTVNFVLSAIFAFALIASSDILAVYFSEPELAGLIMVGSLAFAVAPFSTPVMGLLQREMSFGIIAWISSVSAAVGSAATVALGLGGYGPISYLWGSLLASVLALALALRARPDFWIFRPSLAAWRGIFSFGLVSSSTALVNIFYDTLSRFALGRMIGLDAVGLYGRAMGLCQLPDKVVGSALQPVVLPAMAAHARSAGDLKRSYLQGFTLVSAVQWPVLVTVALLAEPIVAILLGHQWLETVPLVRILAVALMTLAPAFMTYPVLVSVGRVRDTLTCSLISLPPSILIVLAAASIDVQAVAYSMFLTAPLQMFVALLFVRRAIGFRWIEFAGACGKSLVVAVATALGPIGVIALSPSGLALGAYGTAIALLGAGLGWLAALHLVRHPLAEEPKRFWVTINGSSAIHRMRRAVARP